jgi:hypothetical protein
MLFKLPIRCLWEYDTRKLICKRGVLGVGGEFAIMLAAVVYLATYIVN